MTLDRMALPLTSARSRALPRALLPCPFPTALPHRSTPGASTPWPPASFTLPPGREALGPLRPLHLCGGSCAPLRSAPPPPPRAPPPRRAPSPAKRPPSTAPPRLPTAPSAACRSPRHPHFSHALSLHDLPPSPHAPHALSNGSRSISARSLPRGRPTPQRNSANARSARPGAVG